MRKEMPKEIYKEVELESERQAIAKEYGLVESTFNEYVEKKIDAQELVNKLGQVASGITGKYPSSQVYAYELLLRAVGETDSRPDQDLLAGEIIFNIITSGMPIKKEFLYGILANFSSKELEAAREDRFKEEPFNAKLEEEINIYHKLIPALARLRVQKNLPDEMKYAVNLILTDFPKDAEEGERARLMAKLYAGEPRGTEPPHPKRRLLDQLSQVTGTKNLSTGIPWLVYTLPQGRHTSQRKIDEAQLWGVPLFTEIAKVTGQEKVGVIFDIDPKAAEDYIRRMRKLLDKGDYSNALKLREAYHDELWQQLDQPARAFFGSRGETQILVQTIRDYPLTQSSSVSPQESQERE